MTAIQKQQFEMAPQGKFTNFYTLIFFSLFKNSFHSTKFINYLCNTDYLRKEIEFMTHF